MSWYRRLFRRAKAEAELNEDIRFYLDMETQLRIGRGESPEEAMRAARRDFGNVTLVREITRQTWGWSLLENFVRDLRYGARLLLRSPVFAGTAIVSLALGIGANTAIFSLMDLVMLRMLPVREPARLVQIQKITADGSRGAFSYPMFEELRNELRSFDGMLGQSGIQEREIVIDGRQETVKGQMVSGNYYHVLGVSAQLGHTLSGDTAGPVAVISHRYWTQRFGSNPAAIGKTFRLNKAVLTIVGVMPSEFFGTVRGVVPDITIPMSLDGVIGGRPSWTTERGISWVSVMGRLRAGVTIEQARAEVLTVFARILDVEKDRRPAGRARDLLLAQKLELYPAGNGFDDLRREFSEPLVTLMGVVALVLLIACANIANLLLARCAARSREMAVRLAVGAGRVRIVRQLLTEGFLLSAVGGVLGVLLAVWFGNWLIVMMSNSGERIALNVRPDTHVLAFACGASLFACLLFSLAPAIQASGGLQATLAEIRSGRWRLGKGLIVAQSAISLLLLIGTGLFGRTLYNMYSQDTGFDRRGVLTFWLDASKAGYQGAEITRVYQRVIDELRSLPGVTSASSMSYPLMAGRARDGFLTVEGYTHSPAESDESHLNVVGPDFFRTLATPVIMGREFDERDTPASKRVAVVNESFARYYFKDRSPIGRWLRERETFEIVGVVKDMKYRNLRLDAPRTVYFAQTQVGGWHALIVRATTDTAAMLRSLKAAVGRVDRSLHVMEPRTMDELMSRSLLHERILATLASAFGGLALLLAAVGIYGVMAFQVARRRKEIGIRMALGARPAEVVAMVVGQTARLVLLGSAIGILFALALTRVTEKLLYGITPTDPATFFGAVAGLTLVMVVASYLPGRTATRINPIESLRCE